MRQRERKYSCQILIPSFDSPIGKLIVTYNLSQEWETFELMRQHLRTRDSNDSDEQKYSNVFLLIRFEVSALIENELLALREREPVSVKLSLSQSQMERKKFEA